MSDDLVKDVRKAAVRDATSHATKVAATTVLGATAVAAVVGGLLNSLFDD